MTAKVNLLPQQTRESAQATTSRLVAGLLFLLLFVALGGAFWWISAEVSDAENELADEQAITAGLEADQAALAEFAELETRLAQSSEVLSAAMSGEVSIAGFLQDLALVTPPDAQLDTLAASIDPFRDDEEGEEVVTTVGQFVVTGASTSSHAPGLERLLLDFEKIATIADPFLTQSILEDTEGLPEEFEDQIASFTIDGRFTLNARTDRYTDGLPEVFR